MRRFVNILIWVGVILILAATLQQTFHSGASPGGIGGAVLFFIGVIIWQSSQKKSESGETSQDGSFATEFTRLKGLVQESPSEGTFVREVLHGIITQTDRCLRIARTDVTISKDRRVVLLPALGDLKIALERAWTTGVIDDHQEAALEATAQARDILAAINS